MRLHVVGLYTSLHEYDRVWLGWWGPMLEESSEARCDGRGYERYLDGRREQLSSCSAVSEVMPNSGGRKIVL